MTYCIGGIDTGIGKTVATGLMYRWLLARKRDAITVKLVQTGNTGFSEDLLEHRRIAGAPEQPEDAEGLTAPQIFSFPASPALAAAREGRSVDTDAILRAVQECERRRGTVLAETAGGLMAPLSASMSTADFIAAAGWPLVLVSCGRLGSINHTLLSLECAKARGIRVAGIVWNAFPAADPEIDADARAAALGFMSRAGWNPALVECPALPEPGRSPELPDFSPVLG